MEENLILTWSMENFRTYTIYSWYLTSENDKVRTWTNIQKACGRDITIYDTKGPCLLNR